MSKKVTKYALEHLEGMILDINTILRMIELGVEELPESEYDSNTSTESMDILIGSIMNSGDALYWMYFEGHSFYEEDD